jgi:hypothetical protein
MTGWENQKPIRPHLSEAIVYDDSFWKLFNTIFHFLTKIYFMSPKVG